MLPLVAPLVLLALSTAVPTMGKLSQRKGKTKDKKRLAAAAAATGISPIASPPSSPNKVRGAAALAAEAIAETERELRDAEDDESRVLCEADRRVCWAWYYWHVLGHPDESEWDRRKDGTLSRMCTALRGPKRL
eukprot:COSAG05_NODE_8035_length_743_cov_0.877329_1_plen_134_part_00